MFNDGYDFANGKTRRIVMIKSEPDDDIVELAIHG